jgi:hypothetical protein
MKPLVRMDDTAVEWVSDLFVPRRTRIWDEQLVQRSFVPFEAAEILKLRPGTRMQEDISAWADERSGMFSVRSCYCMLKE